MMLDAWAEHQKTRPDVPEEYLVNINHWTLRMDEWERADQAWRLIIGINLANKALRERLGDDGS